jgi:uroporphyrinogen III methyltransferase/synthase
LGLDGRRVVVTRSTQQSGGLAGLLRERGAEVIEMPTIAIEPPESWTEVDDAVRRLAQGEFEWVTFTSANAVERFFSRLGCMPAEVFSKTKVAAVGSATGALLNERGVGVDLVPDTYTAVDVARALGPGSGSVLLPRAADVPPDMARALQEAGWQTHEVAAYRTVPADRSDLADNVVTGGFDIITFTSASTVGGFIGMFSDAAALLTDKIVACIGPVTAEACRAAGLKVDVEATEHTASGLVDALAMAT